MRNDDVMAQLREANRVSETTLSATDRGALDALREGITMTTRPTTPTRAGRRRFARRSVLAAGLSLTVIGGGAAYAAYQQLFVATDTDHLSCVSQWEPSADGQPEALSGPVLTGDPVADCQAIRADAGASPIQDPVAFETDAGVFVAPRSQVPQGATLLEGTSADGAAALELRAGLADWVDGLGSRCHTLPEAAAVVRSELDRLGLETWTVDESGAAGPSECAGATVDATNQAVEVVAGSVEARPSQWSADDPSAHVYALRDTLRADVAEQCLSLTQAAPVAEAALALAGAGAGGAPPLVTVVDPQAACTRVDLEVGGAWLVTLRGPEVLAP